jgi:hypothetical protein
VVRFCDRDSTGALVDPLGPTPIGYFVYTATGELSIQAMRTPPAGPTAGGPVQLPSLGDLRPFYFGYFGTYSVQSESTVVHHVQRHIPDWHGSGAELPHSRNTLSIGAPRFGCRVLVAQVSVVPAAIAAAEPQA